MSLKSSAILANWLYMYSLSLVFKHCAILSDSVEFSQVYECIGQPQQLSNGRITAF